MFVQARTRFLDIFSKKLIHRLVNEFFILPLLCNKKQSIILKKKIIMETVLNVKNFFDLMNKSFISKTFMNIIKSKTSIIEEELAKDEFFVLTYVNNKYEYQKDTKEYKKVSSCILENISSKDIEKLFNNAYTFFQVLYKLNKYQVKDVNFGHSSNKKPILKIDTERTRESRSVYTLTLSKSKMI